MKLAEVARRWRAFTQLLLELPREKPEEAVFRLAAAWLGQSTHQEGCQCHPCAVARIIKREWGPKDE